MLSSLKKWTSHLLSFWAGWPESFTSETHFECWRLDPREIKISLSFNFIIRILCKRYTWFFFCYFTIYIKKTVFNLEAIVFSISSIQKVVQFSKSNPTNYLEESRDKQHHCSRFVYYLKPLHSTLIRQFMAFYCYLYVFRRLWTFWIESVVSLYKYEKAFQNDHLPLTK